MPVEASAYRNPASRLTKRLLSPVIPVYAGATRNAEEGFASRRSPVRSRYASPQKLAGNNVLSSLHRCLPWRKIARVATKVVT